MIVIFAAYLAMLKLDMQKAAGFLVSRKNRPKGRKKSLALSF
jgi:hypothetical protein